jgi:hypothetical protein
VGTHIAYTLETHEDNDFKHFWITSRIALQGQNIYDPENHHQVLSTLDSSEATDEFITRLVNTGFWYPPTSVLIFLPVGLFDLEMAWVINYIYLILFFLCTIRFLL